MSLTPAERFDALLGRVGLVLELCRKADETSGMVATEDVRAAFRPEAAGHPAAQPYGPGPRCNCSTVPATLADSVDEPPAR